MIDKWCEALSPHKISTFPEIGENRSEIKF